jgi:hypothetical protein
MSGFDSVLSGSDGDVELDAELAVQRRRLAGANFDCIRLDTE